MKRALANKLLVAIQSIPKSHISVLFFTISLHSHSAASSPSLWGGAGK